MPISDTIASSRQGQLLAVQISRAAAALVVAFAHIPGLGQQNPVVGYGAVGVDVFFVISGFIMVYSARDLFAAPGGPSLFAKRRLARIVPLYYAASAATVAWYLYVGPGAPTVTLDWVISTFMFVPYDEHVAPITGVGWTLNYEMFFYAVFAVTLVWSRRTAIIALSAAFVAGVVVRQFVPLPFVFFIWLNPIILEFLFGVSLGVLYLNGFRLPPMVCLILVVAGVALFALSIPLHYYAPPIQNLNFTRPFAWGIPALLIVSGAALSSQPLPANYLTKSLALLGDASYCIYLSHPLFYEFATYHIVSSSNWAGRIAEYLGWLTLFSVAVYLLFEQPLKRWLSPKSAPAISASRSIELRPAE
jgi:exopolysaccharide production protein ExoZ